ncbi:MAG TPA: S8 family serine peptidase, partial [Anaerolineae bacterium]|nr:S8 family serine peptidase [Anaerolineae bacterium]
MRQNFKYVVPLLILMMLLVSACELQRSEEGDIAVEPPGVSGPTSAPPTVPPPPPQEEPSAEPSQEAPAAGGGAGDEIIDPNGVPAPQTPSEGAVTPGTVVLKLNEEASIQARSVELDNNNIVVSGVNSLDQKLQEIGASDLQPVLEPVAESTGQDLNTLSIQAEQMSQLYTVSFSDNEDPVAVAATLNEDPNVEFAEPDYIAGITGRPSYAPAAFQPNDPYFSNHQWNLQAIQMTTAWDVTRGRDIVVAIIDTGVAFDAPDLAGTARMTGYDFVSNDADPRDDNGHGTHVAGTVA